MPKRKRRIKIITVKTDTMRQEHYIPKQRTSEENARREQSHREDTRRPSAALAEQHPAGDARTEQEAQAQEHHRKVVEDVEAVMSRIDDMVASIGDVAIQAA